MFKLAVCRDGCRLFFRRNLPSLRRMPPPRHPEACDGAAAQQPVPVSQTIKKESRLVLVDTVVTDKKGNYIHDLTQDDFQVYEDNKEQTISSFSTGADAAGPQNPQSTTWFFSSTTLPWPCRTRSLHALRPLNSLTPTLRLIA